jgi:hypothetical protein
VLAFPLSMVVRPAPRYQASPDLWVVTCYFNPRRYKTKRENYERFAAPLRAAGLPLVTVECAFPWTGFELEEGRRVIRLQTRDVMWQKERLLNVVISQLPAEATKVAWLDCDVAFSNPSWARETSERLETFPVVQLFEKAVRLPRGHGAYTGEGDVWKGFAASLVSDPDALFSGRFDRHGHTGFAWAARRDFLQGHGLYDTCVAGSGDHLMAHAFCGDWDSTCIDRIVGGEGPHRARFQDWSRGIYPSVRARLAHVSGTVLHFWHGEFAHRRYVDRNRELADFGFDPGTDLRMASNGCWEWASPKPELHRWAVEYFGSRREDGDAGGTDVHD